MSYMRPLQFFEEPDGNSHISQFIDWSARRHDVLYVVAWGNSDQPDFRAISDNYNGITMAASETTSETSALYQRYSVDVNASSGDASGDRTSIDLLAPGREVGVLGWNDQQFFVDGSSYATSHGTGAAALLHQFAKSK